MTPFGQTERLLLRPIALADADQIQRIFPQWEVVRYLVNRVPWPYPPDGVREFLEQVALPLAERGEAWTWTLRLKSDPDRIIGSLDLRKGDEDNRGFWLDPKMQGRGFMSEACAWSNDFWFDTLGFRVLRVAKASMNLASRRISLKQGMRLVGTAERDYVSGRLPSEIWELTAAEWRARRAQMGTAGC
jgi:RimJ/RimL family protein N-acetyltransferase